MRLLRLVLPLFLLVGSGAVIVSVTAATGQAAASVVSVQSPDPGSQPALLPAPGQFVGVPVQRVLDTRFGTGETGGPAQLTAGASLTVTVDGVDGVPSDATSVVVNVVALNTAASGFLTTYDSDNPDPDIASVGVRAGISTNQTDTIRLSSSGTVTVANHSSGPLDVVMTLMGYYTGSSDAAAGDTYSNAPWVKIVDTTTGLGAPQQQIPAGGSLTVQIGGEGGIGSGADTAVVQLSALNATQSGYLTAYAEGSADPGVSLLFYDSSMTYRDLSYVPLSAAGEMTIANHGSGPVDVTVVTRGYFLPPAATLVGAEYAPVGPVDVYGSASSAAQVAANASVTFQVAGTAGLPSSGLVEVAEHIVVTNPAASGFLDAYRGGGIDPDNATMNFLSGDGTDVGYQDSILSQVSPTGQETITNHSSGSVNVEVAVVGIFYSPQVPPIPTYLQTAATYTTTPVLSGIVQDATGDDLTGEIFLFDSSGNPIGGAPTATGEVNSGEAVSWTVTDGTLANGDTYQWYMEACDQGVCSAPTATQTFTVNTADAPSAPTATATATITGSSISGADAITDPAACSGSDCSMASGATLPAGSDGTNNWGSSLKLDMSSIPAGSQVVSATLKLTESSCLTGTSCASTPIDVYQPSSDVAGVTTGPQLAANAMPNPVTAISPASQGSWDITGFVQGWVAGEPNDGLIIQAPTAGAAGISYYSPSANVGATSLPQVTISYVPPAVPSAPSDLTVTPGDGGALVSWAPPSWNYDDATGNATATYTVQATIGSTVAATVTTTDEQAAITGLADGTAYTISVTATNPVGTSPAASSSSVTPVSVQGGPSQYIQATSQFLNAQDTLIEGTATNAVGALANESQSIADISQLSNEDLTDDQTATLMAMHNEQDTADSTALSNTLAMPAANGTVTVYATADETFTTVDTDTGTSVSIPGEDVADELFTFSTSGGTPQLTGYVDADTALTQVGEGGEETAYSPNLDGPALAPFDNETPQPIATDSSGNFTSGTEAINAPCISATSGGQHGGYDCPNRTNEVKWALAHSYPGTSKDHNGFADDCTDFSSRSLAFGGGLPEDLAPFPAGQTHNDNYWYQHHGILRVSTSRSWDNSRDLFRFFWGQGSYFIRYGLNAKPGYIIFAAWNGGSWHTISHAGVITAVNGHNIYITQHTRNRKNEAFYRENGRLSWYGTNPHLSAWIAIPSRLS